jgi:hypothetical protein
VHIFLDLFDDVMASNKHFNMSSHNKAYKLVERFGEQGFDYIGDHMRDLIQAFRKYTRKL